MRNGHFQRITKVIGEGWASSLTGEANLPEEGTTTGLAIGFDEWFTGGDPECTPGIGDCVGMSIRFENTILAEISLPTLNGALDDISSLQTGPRDSGLSGLGWAELTLDLVRLNPEPLSFLIFKLPSKESRYQRLRSRRSYTVIGTIIGILVS